VIIRKMIEIVEKLSAGLDALNETAERYLVAQPTPEAARTPGFTIELIEGNRAVPNKSGNNYICFSLLNPNAKPLEDYTDQELREKAKKYYDNITDDIRIKRF